MKPESKLKSLLRTSSSLLNPKKWTPKTQAERRRENLELDGMKEEMEPTLAGLSPEMQTEIRELSNSKDPRDAELKLIDYVITEDHSKQLRKQERRGYTKGEGRMHEWIYWLAFVPVLITLYVIFNWLTTGHFRFWKP
jgi:hypothetical protein